MSILHGMARRIRKAQIKFVSLVPKGANLLTPVYKADGSFSVGCLSTAAEKFDESGELLNVVYAPEHRDSQGDVADAAVIKDAAYEFVANGAGVDINHDGKPLPRERARIAETFLVQKTDTRFHGWKDAKGNAVNLEGAWATVIKIDDPELRKKYRSGEWGGVSMGGTAVVEAEKSEEEGFFSWLRKTFSSTQPTKQSQTEEPTMTPEEIKKAVADGIAAGLAANATAVETQKAADLKKAADAAPKGPVAPVFKGSRANPRDLQLHERALEAFELEKSTDFGNSASVKTYREAVTEMRKAWAEEDAADGIVDPKPAGRRGPSVGNPLAAEGGTDAEMAKLGKQLAETMNKSRGATVEA